jgi:hypothetical protein
MHQNLIILYSIALMFSYTKQKKCFLFRRNFNLLKNEDDYSECDIVESGTP